MYFLFFLAMLAATLLLYGGAVATTAITRRSPPTFIGPVAANRLQSVGIALLWWSAGVTWLLYFNVYRIHVDMSALGNAAFHAFARAYTSRLPVVVLPFGAMCLVWTLALWGVPTRVSRRALWGVATLLIISIASTPWAAGAHDLMHDSGYTDEAYNQLQFAHLVRSLAVTAATVWAHVEAWRLPSAPVA
ncbi:hypothetical protein [Roseateles sp.]|uniref:hypothetical protein n=1 Tax=Roseateles sp. TaxID=1971397 RepID=UPI003265D64E